MSERVTHTAVLDDCFRLAIGGELVREAFREVARGHRELARLASATRWGDRFTVPMLERLRREWPGRTPEAGLAPRLAYVLGWLCHRAADRQMKPVFRSADPGSKLDPTDCSVYHDAFIYKEVYLNAPDSPYDSWAFGIDAPPEKGKWEVARDLFHTLLQQSLIELHTFIPDPEDGWGWVDRVETLRQRFRVDLERYARAVAEPDPEKVRRFIVEPKFYLADDPLPALARRIQRGETVEADAVHKALSQKALSHYGAALRKGLTYLYSADAFFAGDLSAEELRVRLDIGKSDKVPS
jgi:hypothetical protein